MWNLGDNSVGATKPYLEYAKQYGEVILLSPNSFIENLDLLILPGGKDVATGGAGEYSFLNSDNERFLEHFDHYTLPKYIESNTPIFGICRGMQALMRHFKIPLLQNIFWGHGYSSDENDTDEHVIVFTDDFAYLRAGANGKGKVKETKIGSWHHQAVNMETMAQQNEFDVVAHTIESSNPYFQVVEAVKHRTLPISGVQSHPERNYAMHERQLILELLNIEQPV